MLRYRRVELRTQADLGLSEPADDGQQRHRYKDAWNHLNLLFKHSIGPRHLEGGSTGPEYSL